MQILLWEAVIHASRILLSPSNQPATCPYYKTDKFSQHIHSFFLISHFNNIPPSTSKSNKCSVPFRIFFSTLLAFDSSVSIVNKLHAERLGNRRAIPDRGRRLSLFLRVQTDIWAHLGLPYEYIMETRLFPKHWSSRGVFATTQIRLVQTFELTVQYFISFTSSCMGC